MMNLKLSKSTTARMGRKREGSKFIVPEIRAYHVITDFLTSQHFRTNSEKKLKINLFIRNTLSKTSCSVKDASINVQNYRYLRNSFFRRKNAKFLHKLEHH